MAIVKCAECGKEEEYELKPGFPRKYCSACSAKKKAEYANKNSIPPATEANREMSSEDFNKDGSVKMSYSDKDRSIIAQCLTKIVYSEPKLHNAEDVLDTYRYFVETL